MNGKISSGQVFTTQICLIVALFPGLINILLLNISRNASILSVLIATIIGFIPVIITAFISTKITNKSLKDYMIEKLGFFGKILNLLLIIIAIIIIFINSWLTVDFIISQFLTRTSYYLITLIFFTITCWSINKGIETTSRTYFVLFIITVIIMISLWFCLISYVKLDNLKPYIDVTTNKVVKSSIIYLTYTTLPIIYILDLKHITNDKKNFKRKIITAYITASFIIITFLFLIISIYTIDLASILTYPVYSLFKKIQILGFIERIENFAAIQIIATSYIQISYLIYYLKENISKTLKLNKNKTNILTYLIGLLIPLISIYFFKNNNLNNFINILPYILSILLPILIILSIASIKKRES